METTYVCYIKSNSSHGRSYDIETRIALKAADMYGRFEGGETVTIYRKRSRKVIDRAITLPKMAVITTRHILTKVRPCDEANKERKK